MNAEIIAVGSELLTPARIDTNSLFLTEHLNSLGIEVVSKMVIGDDRTRLAESVRACLLRSEIVILTGGLGPTEDDITREAVADALGRGLVWRQDLCDGIERRFARMGRKMADVNKRQAYLIEGAEELVNDNGTAPGQWLDAGGRAVMLLPGPPPELRPMFTRECLSRLARLVPPLAIRTLVFRVAGMPESDLDQLISPVYKQYGNPVTTILAAPGDIQIHLRARSATAEEAVRLLAELGAKIEPLLGDRIYSRNGDTIEAVVGALLRERGATLSVAESCTGGLLAGRITDVPGSSDYFLGGFLVYANRLKSELLGIDSRLIEEHGAVSEPVAEAMAVGAGRRTGSDYALSVTGVAGPGGGTEKAPAGTVCLGLAHPQGSSARRFRFLGDRARVRTLAAHTALDLLRKLIATAG
jgi:nicotinamide-nucleotide amidase